ncbi:MAG: class I adenylate-forming enzyme family protein [Cyanobacteria bacterium P01_H01_bin.15]
MPLSGRALNYSPINTAGILYAGLQRNPNDLAIVSTTHQWTWQELNTATHNLALNLLNLGLLPGDRVASLMPNRSTLLIHYMACMRAGLIAVPLNYRYMPPEIDYALEVSGAKLLVAHAERIQDLTVSKLASSLPKGIIYYENDDGKTNDFHDLIQSSQGEKSLPKNQPTDPAFIFFTSGSTGRPKGVTHSHHSAANMFATKAEAFELTPDDVMLSGSSLSHIGAFVNSFATLAIGARVIVAKNYHDDEMLTLLRQQQPTVLFMLPAALLHLIREKGSLSKDFSSLRLCISGGDHVQAELEREFKTLTGLEIDEIYGMSEIGLLTVHPPSGKIKMGSVGVAAPCVSLSIQDDSYQELSPSQTGRLWARTKSVTIGYWNNSAATNELFHKGWLDTGDLMEADEEGYLYFRGRKKQVIVHDGSNISPQEVEDILLEHLAVECAGVVGVHDLMHGENVRAYVTLKANITAPSALELIRFAHDRIGYKAPKEIEFLDEMPLNPTGKVDRASLKRLAEIRHSK